MSFNSLQLQRHYDSDSTDVLQEFYRPLLQKSNRYDRAVGFFSSSTFKSCASELAAFIGKGGQIRMVIGCLTQPADVDALRAGAKELEEQERHEIRIQIHKYLTQLQGEDPKAAQTFAKMVQSGVAKIKFAVRRQGIYHEKYGIFHDEAGNRVSFIGSLNETSAALSHGFNHESISVYQSIEEEIYKSYGIALENKFENLWNAKANQTRIYELDDKSLEIIKKIAETQVGENNKNEYKDPFSDLWDHQKEAVNIFLKEKKGILEMATGTGKTKTSIAIIMHLLQNKIIDNVIVSTKGNDLLRQWIEQLISISAEGNLFNLFQHIGDGRRQIDEYLLSVSAKKCVIVLSYDNLDKVLKNLDQRARLNTLLVMDEVHNIGSPNIKYKISGLNSDIGWILGLSATPEREYDEDGNEFIEKFAGKTIFAYGLNSAIKDGILCPFEYYPLHYESSLEDREKIKAVYSKQAARAQDGRPMSDAELFIELSKVHKLSKAKIPIFDKFISQHPDFLKRAIIFVEETSYGDNVLDIVHKYRSDFHTYYSEDDVDTLRRFARGELECLITCHKVSEGIDIKSLETVVLFSSSRARLETVQRIGRCLRSVPGIVNKIANVIDFIRNDSKDDGADLQREKWLKEISNIRREDANALR